VLGDGVVSDDNLETGNPPDAPMLAPAIERIRRRAGRAPRAVTADRGYGEIAVEHTIEALGVANVVLPPTASRPRSAERTSSEDRSNVS